MRTNPENLVETIDALLPQTQCTRCGYPACRAYAEAIVQNEANINQCPPGGTAGIAKLSTLLNRPALPLNRDHGVEQALRLAEIDEALCIGCTLCIQACPVDAIVGAPKKMHTVIPQLCTGCDLCLPPCPMDCIAMVAPVPARSWSPADANASRARYEARQARMAQERFDTDERRANRTQEQLAALKSSGALTTDESAEKSAVVAAAIERARARRQAAPS